jgi:hypothetical protein
MYLYLLGLLYFVKMLHQLKLKQTIISVIPLYISIECQAFNELKQAIENIPDDKFVQTINKKSLTITERIHHLFDEVFCFGK